MQAGGPRSEGNRASRGSSRAWMTCIVHVSPFGYSEVALVIPKDEDLERPWSACFSEPMAIIGVSHSAHV